MEAVLAGDGPLRRDLERLAADLGIHDRVLFLGQLPHDEVLRLLASGEYDLVAMTSTPIDGAKEGIPVSLMESMAHSIPVLATNLGGISELVGEGAGVLVPPGDEHVLAEALCHLAANPAVRASLAIAGRRRVEEEFSVDVVAARLETLFEDAARRPK
jgi:glycosyltransferase involved in cell wall biosynthesis